MTTMYTRSTVIATQSEAKGKQSRKSLDCFRRRRLRNDGAKIKVEGYKWVLLLLFLFNTPLYAIVLESNPTNTTQEATQAETMAPAPAQIASSPLLTSEQSNALLKQAQNLNPDQLQAIAKSFQPQQQQPTTEQNLNVSQPVAPKPPRKKSMDELKREQAFNSLLEDVLPLSPDQIMKLHKFYDLTLQAKATTPTPPPTPQFTSTVVNLDPGSAVPVIRLAAGFVTSLIFVDTTGAAWPITAYSIGDAQSFNIQWDHKSNAMFIQSLKQYGHGNLAVRLWGLDTPVMITLVSGQRNVDFRVDLQVAGRGPDAKAPVVETAFNAKVNPLIMNILDGIPPVGSIKLNVTGAQGEAWYVDNKVYFRTKLTVLSPAWIATVSSPDGMHVYEMMLTPHIIASQNGKTVDIKLSGL